MKCLCPTRLPGECQVRKYEKEHYQERAIEVNIAILQTSGVHHRVDMVSLVEKDDFPTLAALVESVNNSRSIVSGIS